MNIQNRGGAAGVAADHCECHPTVTAFVLLPQPCDSAPCYGGISRLVDAARRPTWCAPRTQGVSTVAIALIFDGPGVSQAQYDQVRNEVSPNNRRPAGMLYHVGGPTKTGWQVTEVWESQEAADRFFQATLGQALKKANINIQPQVFAVHNIMTA